MSEEIKAGRTILLNTATNCTFIANEFDAEHTLEHPSHVHIEWCGELDFDYIQKEEFESLKQENELLKKSLLKKRGYV